MANTFTIPSTTIRIKAGHGSAAAGIWLRSIAKKERLLLPTVAHVLFDRNRNLRSPVYVNGAEAHLEAIVPLTQHRSFDADVSTLSVSPEIAQAAFFPAEGHVNQFYKLLIARRLSRTGEEIHGKLTNGNWSGNMIYHFGKRHLTQQWIITLDYLQYCSRNIPGDSGAIWMTSDGYAIGLQIGFVREQPQCVIITPMERICTLFDARIAR